MKKIAVIPTGDWSEIDEHNQVRIVRVSALQFTQINECYFTDNMIKTLTQETLDVWAKANLYRVDFVDPNQGPMDLVILPTGDWCALKINDTDKRFVEIEMTDSQFNAFSEDRPGLRAMREISQERLDEWMAAHIESNAPHVKSGPSHST